MRERSHRRAHRSSLAAPRPTDDSFRKFWDNFQAILDSVLTHLERRFSEYRALIDELISKDVPGSKDIEMLRGKIPNSVITSQYFFSHLKSPLWLKPLREAGVFREIPEPIPFEGGISIPPWPAAEYLRRCVLHTASHNLPPECLSHPAGSQGPAGYGSIGALCLDDAIGSNAPSLGGMMESDLGVNDRLG